MLVEWLLIYTCHHVGENTTRVNVIPSIEVAETKNECLVRMSIIKEGVPHKWPECIYRCMPSTKLMEILKK